MTSEGEESPRAAPISQFGRWLAHPRSGEEIVISGISGYLPESDGLLEFYNNLMNKVDMVTDDERRWKKRFYTMPHRTGKVKNAERFDASFFDRCYHESNWMDPMYRMVLERSFEAVLDAGVNPASLEGRRLGVYIALSNSETESLLVTPERLHRWGCRGASRALLPGFVTRAFRAVGPSYLADTACSSAMHALDDAYRALRLGQVDAALVGGCNLTLIPRISQLFYLLGVLCLDGRCKSFDETADGYARSEAIVVVFLQRSADARRAYATVAHVASNCDGFKDTNITFPSEMMQKELLLQTLGESDISPEEVDFHEAHGTGTRVGDPVEMRAIDYVFGKHYSAQNPLLIGSVRSNIGHPEPVSGLCSIAKIILAMETGIIGPNINFDTPKREITSLVENKFKVVTEPTKKACKTASISSFGFGGANSHLLLRWNPREKESTSSCVDDLPTLVVASGRSRKAVRKLLGYVSLQSPVNAELISLYNNTFSKPIPGNLYRGYQVFGRGNVCGNIPTIQATPSDSRKVWFLFPGVGSAWPGMARELMNIPLFASTINMCHEISSRLGVNLRRIMLSVDEKIITCVDNVMAFVAMQLALVDVLRGAAVEAGGFVGGGVGELAAAYADGCLGAPQAMLAAFHLASAMSQDSMSGFANLIVDLPVQKLSMLLPPTLRITMINSVNSCTISGPKVIVHQIAATLRNHGVTVKELNCPSYLLNDEKYFQGKVISMGSAPHLWISTTGSRPSCSPQHILHALQHPADFSQALLDLPSDAVLVEVSPDCWVCDHLSHQLLADITCVQLMKKGCKRTFEQVLDALGRLYVRGISVKPSLFPEVSQPVTRGTPMIAPALSWNHEYSWEVCNDRSDYIGVYKKSFSYNFRSTNDKFLLGHVVDGRSLFPASGYLFMVVQTIATFMDYSSNDFMVIFENAKLYRATHIRENKSVDFSVSLHKESGHFEITESNASVATGKVRYHRTEGRSVLETFQPPPEVPGLRMTSKDVYKELRLRGYEYRDMFRSIHSVDIQGSSAMIKWHENWIVFLDNMLQVKILTKDTRNLYVPVNLARLVIDFGEHQKVVEHLGNDQLVQVTYDRSTDTVRAAGVEVRGLSAVPIARKKDPDVPLLETCRFVPHSSPGLNLSDMLRVCIQFFIENTAATSVKILEVAGHQSVLAGQVISMFDDIKICQLYVTVLLPPGHPDIETIPPEVKLCFSLEGTDTNEFSIIILSDPLKSKESLKNMVDILPDGGFIFLCHKKSDSFNLNQLNLQVIADQQLENEKISILKKVIENKVENEIVLNITVKAFDWLLELQKSIVCSKNKVILFAQGEEENGLIGLCSSLAKEGHAHKIRCFLILDSRAPKFDIHDDFYRKQLKKDMILNVFENGSWGTYRYFRMAAPAPQLYRHVFSNVTSIGDLTTLTWQQGPLDVCLMDGKIDVTEVRYAALNFRDIMAATGRLSVDVIQKSRLEQECVLGLEYSGYSSKGDPVMGLTPRGGLATIVETKQCWEWKVPGGWSLADAATVPVAYLTVIYAFKKGQLKRKESVLIHAGSGGVGQAAINYCLFHGCTVFTTVGTPEKRDFLLKRFSQLSPTHIGNSRDTSFEQMVLKETGGRGVDLVLNSLAEEKLQASLRCLAPGGRFLEIGKFDITQNSMIAMSMLEKSQSFHGILLDEHFHCPAERRSFFTAMLQEALDEGSVVPVSQTVFPAKEIEQAFRFMASGKHIGKVLIDVFDDVKMEFNRNSNLKEGYSRFYCNRKSSYIVVGGLGGFGLEFVDWLILRGARKLVLCSRRGITSGYQAYRLSFWKQYGIELVISTADLGTTRGVEKMIREASHLGPVAGVFNLAVVLRDALLENQTPEFFAESAYPKAVATRLLDQATRRLCPALQHFVVFSSFIVGCGNAGQTNYGFSNSIMERICVARARDGLPGLAIQWGVVGDVGVLSDKLDTNQELVIAGSKQQRLSSCLKVLDRILFQRSPIVSSVVLAQKASSSGSVNNSVLATIAKILGLRDILVVQQNSKLSELGMDSIMGVEIKQAIEQRFGNVFSAQDIRNMTLRRLQELEDTSEQPALDKPTEPGDRQKKNKMLTNLINWDKSTASRPVLTLPSLAESASTGMSVFALPGTDGSAAVLATLARSLKAKVLGMQFATLNCTSVQDIARSLVKKMLPSLSTEIRVNLLGYSYGGVVAMEAMLLLESAGFQGKLVILDSSPLFVKEILMQCFNIGNGDTDETVQNKYLCELFSSSSENNSVNVDKFLHSLQEVQSWDDRIRVFLEAMGRDSHSLEEQLQSIKSVFIRIQAALRYQWPLEKRIRSPVVLIRPTQSENKVAMMDYGLSQCCLKDVDVRFVEGDHVTMLSNPSCANIINAEFSL